MEENLCTGTDPNLRGPAEALRQPAEAAGGIRLTSAEMGNLWSQYIWDSMAALFLRHFAENVNDGEIRTVLDYSLKLSLIHTGWIKEVLTAGIMPVPAGFNESDVRAGAPRLFSDSTYLFYLSYMAKNGMLLYAQALATSTRPDIRSFYGECLNSSRELDNDVTRMLAAKGLYISPPYISPPEKVDFVEKQSFLGSIFGSGRPLHAMEITHLFFNIQRNALGKAVLEGFSRVVQSREIRDYFRTGIEIAQKHIEIFSSLLEKDDIPAPALPETEVTDSTTAPFSDKMMLYHTTLITSVSTSFYGMAMGASNRKDIAVSYARLSAEVLKYGGEGAKLMINNGWMEEPPQGGRYRRPGRELH